jgi:hypothetical protein
MNLRSDTRQNVQLTLDFRSTPTGEARKATTEAVESRQAAHAIESPASTNRLMEEVCERANLREALRRVKAKALNRFKQRIRDITRRAKGVSIETTMDELASFMRGWRGYFGFCETPDVLMYLTRWVRLRLRAALWRQWKTQRRRRAALLALGVHQRLASNTAGSGRGPWYLARAKALSVGLSNAYFKSLGLPSLIEAG